MTDDYRAVHVAAQFMTSEKTPANQSAPATPPLVVDIFVRVVALFPCFFVSLFFWPGYSFPKW